MKCQQAKELFPEYFLGHGGPEIHAHLETCAVCRTEAQALGSLWEKLGNIEEPPPSAALRTNFYAMLQGYRRGLENAKPPLHSQVGEWFAGWMMRPVFQGAMAVALLGIGIYAGHHLPTRQAPPPTELTELRAEVHNMQQVVAVSLLQQQSASERLEGVSWSQRVNRPDPEVLTALLDVMKHDSSVNVRLAALDALRPLAQKAPYSDRVRSTLIQALGQQQVSPMVQVSMIDFVVEAKERRAMDALKRMSADDKLNQVVRERAVWGLQKLNAGEPR
jgi:hypothetical protein